MQLIPWLWFKTWVWRGWGMTRLVFLRPKGGPAGSSIQYTPSSAETHQTEQSCWNLLHPLCSPWPPYSNKTLYPWLHKSGTNLISQWCASVVLLPIQTHENSALFLPISCQLCCLHCTHLTFLTQINLSCFPLSFLLSLHTLERIILSKAHEHANFTLLKAHINFIFKYWTQLGNIMFYHMWCGYRRACQFLNIVGKQVIKWIFLCLACYNYGIITNS